MSDDDPMGAKEPAQAGLITRRVAAERGRAAGVLQITVGLAWLLVGAMISSPVENDGWYWVKLVLFATLGVGNIVMGIARLRTRAKRIAAFDVES